MKRPSLPDSLLRAAAAALGCALAVTAGCSGDDLQPAAEDDDVELPGPSRGNAVILSADDTILAAVNRDAGSLSIFDVSYPEHASPVLKLRKEVQLGTGSEPWQVVLAGGGNKAWVTLRKDQQVVRIVDLRGDPHEEGRLTVGSEPTGLALEPNGKKLWVTSWVDGTVYEVAPNSMNVLHTVDLNGPLAAATNLGIDARPSIAHPRSITAIGMDKEDVRIYVTEYFAQRTAPEAPDGSNADTSKEGVIYRIDSETRNVKVIPLAPIADMGFKDHNGNQAGCYPNQLQSITASKPFAFVTSICASPKGPIGVFTGPANAACTQDADCPGAGAGTCVANKCTTNCSADAQCGANGGKCVANVCAANPADIKVTTSGLVSVIDLRTDKEVASSTFSLNAQMEAQFASRGIADDGTRRYPGVPMDVAFIPHTGDAYVTSNAADSLFHFTLDMDGDGHVKSVGNATNAFINVNPAGIPAAASGKNPIGASIGYTGKPYAFVANDVSRNITVVDLKADAIAGGVAAPVVTQSSPLPAPGSPEDHALTGKRFFETGTGRWSLKGQGLSACQSCHMDGLTDNVTWYFARGPRQSVSLDGTFNSKNPADQRIMNWTAIFDEVSDFEGNTRGISGGVGAIVSKKSAPPVASDRIDLAKTGHAGLNGSADQAADPTNPAGLAAPCVLEDWSNITKFVQAIRSPRAPSNLDPYKVAAGKQLFQDGGCAGCHSGDKWTISTRFYTPGIQQMTDLTTKQWIQPAGFPDALLPAVSPADRVMRGQATNGAFDQIQCILRPVGTFNVADQQAGIAELRQDMKTLGQGNEAKGKGFNPPSLLGLSLGAPYLHAGNASTLESLFSTDVFKQHTTALSPSFLNDPATNKEKIAELIQFLLSIDESTQSIPIPQAGPQGGDFCSTN